MAMLWSSAGVPEQREKTKPIPTSALNDIQAYTLLLLPLSPFAYLRQTGKSTGTEVQLHDMYL